MCSVKFFKLYIIFFICGFVGCSDGQHGYSEQVKEHNINSLSKEGEEIGVLPDGRKVIRYRVVFRKTSLQTDEHFIYIVDGSVTANRSVPTGKYRKNEVTVLFDGAKE